MKRTVSIVVDIASVFDPDGVDVYFLNREPMFHVRSSVDLEILFAMEPEGNPITFVNSGKQESF